MVRAQAAEPHWLLLQNLESKQELSFHAADYFHRLGVTLTGPPFMGVIVIRIGVASSAGNYHVPLLVSPYGYRTYRGS